MGRCNYLPALDFHPGKNLTPDDFGLSLPDSQWFRLLFVTHLLASTGFAIRREITMLASAPIGCQPDSKTLRNLCDLLTRAGLIETRTLPLLHSSKVNVIRLTENGKALCRRYDWDVKESEWDRISKFRSGDFNSHYLSLTLEFAFQARQRGGNVLLVAPEMYQGEVNDLPDLLLADNKTFELPVYILGNTNPSRKVYSNFLENLEGRIGLVALNPHWRGIQRRSAILSGKRGYLTDTETLILGLRDNTPGPLWVGEFIG